MDIILPANEESLSGAAGGTALPPSQTSSTGSGTMPQKESGDQATNSQKAVGDSDAPSAGTTISLGGWTPPAPLKPLRDKIAEFPN